MEPQHDIFDATKNSNSNLTSMVVTNDVHNIHHLVSGNSFDRATSLSDDSGIPLTNSSISSGSSRVGLCKFEFEVIIFLFSFFFLIKNLILFHTHWLLTVC